MTSRHVALNTLTWAGETGQQADRQAIKQADKQSDTQADRQADRQVDRLTGKMAHGSMDGQVGYCTDRLVTD